jgi:hypothetical protein
MGLLMEQAKVNHHENYDNGKKYPEENVLMPITTKQGKEEYIECSQQRVLVQHLGEEPNHSIFGDFHCLQPSKVLI